MLEHRPNKRLIGLLKKNDLISNVKNTNFERLKGGVSSDIWKVKEGDRILAGQTVAIFTPLSSLSVAEKILEGPKRVISKIKATALEGLD